MVPRKLPSNVVPINPQVRESFAPPRFTLYAPNERGLLVRRSTLKQKTPVEQADEMRFEELRRVTGQLTTALDRLDTELAKPAPRGSSWKAVVSRTADRARDLVRK